MTLTNFTDIALHSASSANGAQLYISCGQINVTGGGSANPSKVSFPGAYKNTDAGLLVSQTLSFLSSLSTPSTDKTDCPKLQVNIYYPVPTNYQPPGPAVFTG